MLRLYSNIAQANNLNLVCAKLDSLKIPGIEFLACLVKEWLSQSFGVVVALEKPVFPRSRLKVSQEVFISFQIIGSVDQLQTYFRNCQPLCDFTRNATTMSQEKPLNL